MSRFRQLYLIDRLIILLVVLAVFIAIIPMIYWQAKATGGDLTGVWDYQGSPAGTIIINDRLMLGHDGCNQTCTTYRANDNNLTTDWTWSTMIGCLPSPPAQFSTLDLQASSYHYSVDDDTLRLYKSYWDVLEFKRNPDAAMDYSESC